MIVENQETNNQGMTEPADVMAGLTLDELIAAISYQVLTELDRANEKYPARFNSSNEAHGTLRQEFLEVEEAIRGVKVLNGRILNEESMENCKHLEIELIQLAGACIKTIYSCCELSEGVRDAVLLMRGRIAAFPQV